LYFDISQNQKLKTHVFMNLPSHIFFGPPNAVLPNSCLGENLLVIIFFSKMATATNPMDRHPHSSKNETLNAQQRIEADFSLTMDQDARRKNRLKNTGAFVFLKRSLFEKLTTKVEKILQKEFGEENLIKDPVANPESGFNAWNIRFGIQIPDGSLKLDLCEKSNEIILKIENISLKIF
jgi:hypothetical protein